MDKHRLPFHDQAALLRFEILAAQTNNVATIYEYLTTVVVAVTNPTKHWLVERIQARFPDEQYVPEAVQILAPIMLLAKDKRSIGAARAWLTEAIKRAPSFTDVYKICALFSRERKLTKYIVAAAHQYWENRPMARPELLEFVASIKKNHNRQQLYLTDWLTLQATSATDPTLVVWQALFLARAGGGDGNYAIAQAYLAMVRQQRQLH
jgi:hypothetical protein